MENIQGFFSYSHHDQKTNPSTIEAFSVNIENEINAKLTNTKFSIWRDTKKLRTGDFWDDSIKKAIKNSQIIIILLTPKWIESDYCRKEFEIFEEFEPQVGEYAIPILVRSLEKQINNFSSDQFSVYNRLKQRQYTSMEKANFASLRSNERSRLIAKIADDIEGMIERLRQTDLMTAAKPPNSILRQIKQPPEFNSRAHNYEDVDFIALAEVVVDPKVGSGNRSLYAHIDFLPRMYIQSKSAKIEFAIRRAYLSIDDKGLCGISPNEDWFSNSGYKSAYYVKMRDMSIPLTICMEPSDGRTYLRELSLPPAPGENRFSRIANVQNDSDHKNITAKLIVMLRAESLHVFPAEDIQRPQTVSMRKITAIMNAMIAKEESSLGEKIERHIEVKERQS